MQEEIEQYYLSRRKLAEMMGMNADEMTDLDVEVCGWFNIYVYVLFPILLIIIVINFNL